MANISYVFIAPEDGELLSARYRGVTAFFEKRKVLLVVGDITEEATPEWCLFARDCIYRAMKANDIARARSLGDKLWEKEQALRELQKEAALVGRWDILDYISSILNVSHLEKE